MKKFLLNQLCWLPVAMALSLVASGNLCGQESENGIPPLPEFAAATNSSSSDSQSLASKSMDWLSKQISKPESDESSGTQLFSDPKTKRTAVKTGATLIMVVSLFLLVVFVLRIRKPGIRKGGLPENIVAILGQKQINPTQTLQLVRLGSKLLLVSTSATGSQTLGEITDQDEVCQIETLCREGKWPEMPLIRKRSDDSRQILGSQLGTLDQSRRTLLEA